MSFLMKKKETDAKCFIGSKMILKNGILFIMFPRMAGFINKFDKTQCIFFIINDKELLEKYESIWNRISNIIDKEFDRQLVYDGKYVNTKTKS